MELTIDRSVVRHLCALNCANRVMFVWNGRKNTNISVIMEPFSDHSSHKLIVRPDNFKYFAPRSDPPVKLVQMTEQILASLESLPPKQSRGTAYSENPI